LSDTILPELPGPYREITQQKVNESIGIQKRLIGGIEMGASTARCEAEVSSKTNVAFPFAFVFLREETRQRGCGK
jgi:hypothetical protein